MYFNFKFYFVKVGTQFCEKLHDKTTSWLVEFLYFLYGFYFRSVSISYQHSYNLNNFYNFRALFKSNIIWNWKEIFKWFIPITPLTTKIY